MSKKEYIQANKEWLEAKAKEEGKATPERYLLQGHQWGKERWQASYTTQYRHRPLYRVDYKRKEI